MKVKIKKAEVVRSFTEVEVEVLEKELFVFEFHHRDAIRITPRRGLDYNNEGQNARTMVIQGWDCLVLDSTESLEYFFVSVHDLPEIVEYSSERLKNRENFMKNRLARFIVEGPEEREIRTQERFESELLEFFERRNILSHLLVK